MDSPEIEQVAQALQVFYGGPLPTEAARAAIAAMEKSSMTTTEAQRRAVAVAHKKREANGLKRQTYWFTPQSREKLDRLSASTGRAREAIINEAIAKL